MLRSGEISSLQNQLADESTPLVLYIYVLRCCGHFIYQHSISEGTLRSIKKFRTTAWGQDIRNEIQISMLERTWTPCHIPWGQPNWCLPKQNILQWKCYLTWCWCHSYQPKLGCIPASGAGTSHYYYTDLGVSSNIAKIPAQCDICKII